MSTRQPQLHQLKCHPEFFQASKHGLKPWELRKNDRDYQTGDTVILKQFNPASNAYDEKEKDIAFKIIAVFTGKYLLGMIPDDMVILSLESIGELPF